MDKFEAERHFQSAPVFDYGYSPIFYITEEIACGFVKKKQMSYKRFKHTKETKGEETNVQAKTKEEEEIDFVPSSETPVHEE